MRVQYCTSEVCPLLALLIDFVTDHEMSRCLRKVDICRRTVGLGRVGKYDKLINLSDRCQLKTTTDGGLGNILSKPHQSLQLTEYLEDKIETRDVTQGFG